MKKQCRNRIRSFYDEDTRKIDSSVKKIQLIPPIWFADSCEKCCKIAAINIHCACVSVCHTGAFVFLLGTLKLLEFDIFPRCRAPPSFGSPVNRTCESKWRYIMQKINLRELYPDMYKTDTFLEVTDEVYTRFPATDRGKSWRFNRAYAVFRLHPSVLATIGIVITSGNSFALMKRLISLLSNFITSDPHRSAPLAMEKSTATYCRLHRCGLNIRSDKKCPSVPLFVCIWFMVIFLCHLRR